MSMSVSSTSNALAYLQSLMQSSSSSGAKTNADPAAALEQMISGMGDSSGSQTAGAAQGSSGGCTSQMQSGTFAALLALQGQTTGDASGTSSSGGLFSKIDADGDGQISKTEFEGALSSAGVDTSSADALFSKLDTNSDGNVSQTEMSAAKHHGHHHHGGGTVSASTPATSSQDAGTSQDSATSAASTTQTATNTLLDQLIKLQSQLVSQATSAMSAVV